VSTAQPAVTNISTYLFAPLQNLKGLRDRLRQACKDWDLKGTILLSTEGVNLFVAGPAERIDQLLEVLRAVPGLEGLTPKVSLSEQQPFSRMLVKIKKEIISFGVEGIDPVNKPAPRISARQLKQWLDEGKPVTLLDTRNDYEVKLGTFNGAIPIGVQTFRDFPAATARLQPLPKNQPIVTFCTGGIRCEKAAIHMKNIGYDSVYQLEGGILKYFEEVGGAHYQGDCFVFDHRTALNPQLQETETRQCFACRAVVTPREQLSPLYIEGQSCPHCATVAA
jgi:predicted sulfurtransferase